MAQLSRPSDSLVYNIRNVARLNAKEHWCAGQRVHHVIIKVHVLKIASREKREERVMNA